MELVYIFARTAAAVGLVVLLTRANGLRSFSKMSGFDFAITVAKGSVLASIVMATPENFGPYMVAMAALFVVQSVVSNGRALIGGVEHAIDNSPLLLMRNGEFLEENFAKAQVTKSDIIGKLREANALQLSQVRAVILEDTGDVSVLHGPEDIDDILLDGVRR